MRQSMPKLRLPMRSNMKSMILAGRRKPVIRHQRCEPRPGLVVKAAQLVKEITGVLCQPERGQAVEMLKEMSTTEQKLASRSALSS